MSGATDPAYVLARSVLLDALDALREQLPALILVGAQAVYLRTSDADFSVSPYTTDADLALDPRILLPKPLLGDLMVRARFGRCQTPESGVENRA